MVMEQGKNKSLFHTFGILPPWVQWIIIEKESPVAKFFYILKLFKIVYIYDLVIVLYISVKSTYLATSEK